MAEPTLWMPPFAKLPSGGCGALEACHLHAVRSRAKDVGGGCDDADGKPMRIVKGALAVSHRLPSNLRLRQRLSKRCRPKVSAFLSWRGVGRATTHRRSDRAERPAARRLGGAYRPVARPRCAYRDVTGDAPVTARVVADAVESPGLFARPCRSRTISAPKTLASSPTYCPRTSSRSSRHSARRPRGRMCGDGANDAPAFDSTEGIAVFTATDVAKSPPALC